MKVDVVNSDNKKVGSLELSDAGTEACAPAVRDDVLAQLHLYL